MISVMNNNNFELDRKPDVVEYEPRTKPRVSEDNAAVAVSSDEVANGASFVGFKETGISGCDEVDSSDKVPCDDRGTSLSSITSEEIRFSVVEHEKRAADSETVRVCDVNDSDAHNVISGEIRVSEIDSKGIDGIKEEDMTPRAANSELGDRNGGTEKLESRVERDRVNSAEEGRHVESTPRADDDKDHGRNVKSENQESRVGKINPEVEKSNVARYDSMSSMSDEFEASRSGGAMAVVGPSKPLGYGFEIGDMVWGKVKSHPWWPGQIYGESFASNSVRRAKREGHVLVAFFGDSSYGWFELAELVPFAPNFAEKSRQTNSRTFVKAVEEAVDEVGRRCGLGLACRCRNPYNFRPSDVQGYFAVDVGDYEPGSVYSAKQIKEARSSFQPREVLAFVKQLALTPTDIEHVDITLIKNKATVLAYRKAVFEEFDETYAQAFGYQPVRPFREPTQDVAQHLKVGSRAPLSGPMVIAEALGKGKSSAKSNKAKDHAKKDKYLFKRRDELNKLKSQAQATSSAQPVCLEGSSEIVAGDFVLQKRAPTISAKPETPAKKEHTGTLSRNGASASSTDKPIFSKFSSGSHKQVSDLAAGPISRDGTGTLNDAARATESGGANPSSTDHNLAEGFDQPLSQPATVGIDGREQVQATDAKVQGEGSKMHSDGGVKKAKVRKRPVGELSPEKLVPHKKKKKRERGSMDSDSKQMSASVVNVARRPVQVASVPKEDFRVDPQKEDEQPSSFSLPDSTGAQQISGTGHTELELPQLLRDLQALALNPFHGAVRNPEVVRQVFLRFRYLVFQKRVALFPAADDESNEPRPSKSPAVTAAHDSVPGDNIRDVPSLKPQKPPVRSDDLTKGGRKRAPSDRQEEKVAKRKKFNDVKQLAAEKRTAQEKVAGTAKPGSVKKTEPPARVADDPMMLEMKFPTGGTLPSVNELKARLARFGPLDHSGTRVFWKTLTCRVVYKHKVHAEAACKFAAGSNNLFGNTNVKCYLREVGVAGPGSETGKVQKEDALIGAPQSRDPAVERRQTVPVAAQSLQQSGVQLKSCLKKSGGDEAGLVTGGNGRGTPRVKFMLGGEDGSKVEQLMMGNKNNFNNNASFADGGASSSSTMDFNSKNFQKAVPPPPLPLLPLPNAQFTRPPPHLNAQLIRPPPLPSAQFTRPMTLPNAQFTIPQPLPNAQFTRPAMPTPTPTPTNLQYTEIAPKNDHNFNAAPMTNPNRNASTSSSSTNVEFAQQMMSLLTRCNEVVAGVKDMLGYMPYHPL